MAKEIYTKCELQRLNGKAQTFVYEYNVNNELMPVKHFYRNKPEKIFDAIMEEKGGIMEPYLKDNNGDQKSPINGKINGLFFSAKRNRENPNKLPEFSPFGNKRFIIPCGRLFTAENNLYFADFYCHKRGHHYITLVITKPGSPADEFCRNNILELDKFNNEFLCLESDGKSTVVSVCSKPGLWIEILFTESVDINKEIKEHSATFTSVKPIGTGCSTPGGLPKFGCSNCR